MLDLLAGGIWFSKIVAGAMGQEAQRELCSTHWQGTEG
jgi:hypothetical protein